MNARVRPRLTYANVTASLALIVVLVAGGPAMAEPVASSARSLMAEVKKALRIAKRADTRSKRALVRSGQPGRNGDPGPAGPAGAPGPASGPAGGALTGTYPNPELAPDSVGADQIRSSAVGTDSIANKAIGAGQVADDSLGGGQVDESSLAGFDMSTPDGGFDLSTGEEDEATIGNGLILRASCTGTPSEVGLEIALENASGSTRNVYSVALSDGQPPGISHFSIPDNAEQTVVDLPNASIVDLHHWVTLLVPAPRYETRAVAARTRADESHCALESFRSVRSG